MLTTKPRQSTALQTVDESKIPAAKLAPHLGQQTKAIAPDLDSAEETGNAKIPFVLRSIRIGLQDVAFEHALSIGQLAQTAVEQALGIGTRLWQMKLDLKRKEYGAFLEFLSWSTTKARKYINLAKTFDGFEINQLTGIELTTLLSLCSSRYQKVVAQLREIPDISQELVEQLMKSVRQLAPKQEQISGWKQSRSGGGRYYNVLLHDEQTGVLIEEQAQAQGLLPQKVIADAVTLFAQHKASAIQPSDDVLAQMEEFKQEVGKLRALSIENERLTIQLLEREKKEAQMLQKIAELERMLQTAAALNVKPMDAGQTLNSAPTDLRHSEKENLRTQEEECYASAESPSSQPDILLTIPTVRDKVANAIPVIDNELDPKGQIILNHEYAVKLLLSTKTWEEVALIVGCDRDYLLKAAKTLTIDERQFLVKSLSDYLTREPDKLNTVSWVSKNLLEKALSQLSFILKKIGGPDNLVDEPTIEYVHGCCFVSLQKFGTKYEQWLFQKDGKLFPVFGRDEFIIEKL